MPNPYGITSAQYQELKRVKQEDREQLPIQQILRWKQSGVRAVLIIAVELAGLAAIVSTIVFCGYRLIRMAW